MYEREPRIPLHLGSRATRLADMAEALFWAIDELGPRMPARRDIARHSRVSEATISRRLRDARTTEVHLIRRLVRARRDTYPPGYHTDGWSRWLPETDQDIQDARVWLSCLALAAHDADVADAVRDTWAGEQRQLGLHLHPSPYGEVPDEVEVDAETLRALVLGLAIRRVLDPDLTHERALMLLDRAVGALQEPV